MPTNPTPSGPYVLHAVGTTFTSSSAWKVCDSTSFNDNEAFSGTALGTSFIGQVSPAFAPGAITVDGIGLKLFTVVGTSGTITAALDQAGTTVSGSSVTINLSDLTNFFPGWIFFKFASPITLTAATAYGIKALTSLTSTVTLWQSSVVGGDFNLFLRTTSTQAPAVNDWLYLCTEFSPGTTTSVSMTMDNTASTIFSGVNINILNFSFGIASSTNYLLRVNGNVNVWRSGQLKIGSSGVPLPSTSTAVIELVNTTSPLYSLRNMGGGIALFGNTNVNNSGGGIAYFAF